MMVLSKEIFELFFFLRLSSPADRWFDALGFVIAGSLSSSSTLTSSETQATVVNSSVNTFIQSKKG